MTKIATVITTTAIPTEKPTTALMTLSIKVLWESIWLSGVDCIVTLVPLRGTVAESMIVVIDIIMSDKKLMWILL